LFDSPGNNNYIILADLLFLGHILWVSIDPMSWKNYIDRGIVFGQKGDFLYAINMFKKAIELAPLEPDPHGHLAWQYYQTYKYNLAIKEYETLISLSAETTEVFYLLGDCYFNLERLPECEVCYKKALEIDTSNVNVLIRLADLYAHRKQYDMALSLIKDSLKKLPSEKLETKYSDLLKEKELYDFMIKEPERYFTESLEKAEILRENRNWDLAVIEYKKLLIIQPLNPEIYFKIGCTYMERIMPRYDLAIAAFLKVIILDPGYPDVYLFLAKAQSQYGFMSDAVESYETHIKNHPDSTDALMNLGNLYCLIQEFDKAIKTYKRINKHDNPYLCFNMALCYYNSSNNPQAMDYVSKGLAIDKDNILGKFLESFISGQNYDLPPFTMPACNPDMRYKLSLIFKRMKGRLLKIQCPLCGVAEYDYFYINVKNNWPLVRCPKCGLIYVNPQPVFGRLEELYDDGYMAARKSDADYCFTRRAEGKPHQICMKKELNWLDSQGFKDFEAKRGKDKTFLDIGCAVGVFLLDLESRGWDVHGTDISKSAVDYCCSKGLKVRQGTLEEVNYPDESFDFIVMHHVIEHIPSPANTLKEIMRILKPGGRLFIKTPCCESIPSLLAGEKWFNDPDHIFFFSKATLLGLIKKAGYNIIASHCYVGVDSETYPDIWNKQRINSLVTKAIDKADLGDVIMLLAEKP
jgi:tetratricopeptide (TPR) repeat protein/SAM-dependent methyltransferase